MDEKYHKRLGINTELSLPQACADFYLLERLSFDGNRSAGFTLDKLERGLAKDFSRYLELAVGGEVRYAVTRTSEIDPQQCTCGGKCAAFCTHCDCCEGLHDCGDSYDFKCMCSSCTPEAKADITDLPISDGMTEYLEKWRKKLSDDGEGSRSSAWLMWSKLSEKYDRVVMMDDAVTLFDRASWAEGFGGDAWGTVAKLVRDYYRGKVKPRTFVDQCWSLEHNGGCVFSKAYNHTNLTNLMIVLETQADNRYDDLARRWASSTTGHLWRRTLRLKFMSHDETWLGREYDHYGPSE